MDRRIQGKLDGMTFGLMKPVKKMESQTTVATSTNLSHQIVVAVTDWAFESALSLSPPWAIRTPL